MRKTYPRNVLRIGPKSSLTDLLMPKQRSLPVKSSQVCYANKSLRKPVGRKPLVSVLPRKGAHSKHPKTGELPKPEKEIPKIAVPKLIKIAFEKSLIEHFVDFSWIFSQETVDFPATLGWTTPSECRSLKPVWTPWSNKKGLGRFEKTHEVQ